MHRKGNLENEIDFLQNNKRKRFSGGSITHGDGACDPMSILIFRSNLTYNSIHLIKNTILVHDQILPFSFTF